LKNLFKNSCKLPKGHIYQQNFLFKKNPDSKTKSEGKKIKINFLEEITVNNPVKGLKFIK